MANPPDIQLIVGLGNPGADYVYTRHNAGFWFADELAERYGGRFASERKFHGDVCRISLEGRDVRVLKPMTYMNRSGLAVGALANYLKIPTESILVVYDEIDLPPGKIRLKQGGGAGGHNGLRDIINHISADCLRLRLGVGHPGNAREVHDYVLKRAPKEEEQKILGAVKDSVDAMPVLLNESLEKAKTKLHSRGVEPKPYKKSNADETEDDQAET